MPLAGSKEALAWLFLNATSALKLLFFFSFILSALAFNLFSSFSGYSREYDHGMVFDDEEEEGEVAELVAAVEEEEEEVELGYNYSNIALQGDHNGEQLEEPNESLHVVSYLKQHQEAEEEEEEEDGFVATAVLEEEEVVVVEDITDREHSYLDDTDDLEPNVEGLIYKRKCSSPITIELNKKQGSSATKLNIPNSQGQQKIKESREIEPMEEDKKLARDDDKFSTFAPETKKQGVVNNNNTDLQDHHQKRHVHVNGGDDHEDEPYFGDSCTTIGSTSKDSSEWRSSITFRDSVTEDPFSSSSRRSCPKWESYTIFQKYDEEMMFLDRISAQKLTETESLKSSKVQARTISERIVHQMGTRKKRASDGIYHNNPYNELEAAYVAQICLAWEALSWDYNSFRSKQALRNQQGMKSDLGCPAQVAQQFQQFQVLLQRYNENEPYECGKRPEVYARMRTSVAPKLLLVPEYQDYEDDHKQVQQARIPSGSFLNILEDSIRTFMNFLRADKENPFQAVLKALFRRRKRGSVDPALIKGMKKTNRKKKLKLKDLQRPGNCCSRKKKLTREEEMQILMGLIDLKVVSRVLRMWDLTREQLRWCDKKMTNLSLSKQGKLHRDSSPHFFPAH